MQNKDVVLEEELFETRNVANRKDCANQPKMAHSQSPRLKLIDRKQMLFRAIEIENLVADNHGVRAIWELVGRLDLSAYYQEIKAREAEAGRPAMDPRLMISLWIYSYSKGIGSAREIAKRCEYDPAYQWLVGMEPINYHTLSDFRVDHKEALDELFTQALGLLSAEGLVNLECVMHDGTKIKAHASADTFRREKRIQEHLKLAEEQIKQLSEISEEELSLRTKKARVRAAQERKEKLTLALEELEKIRSCKRTLEEKAQSRVSLTDPEARIMKQPDGGYAPGYNVQISTDAKEKIIVGMQVTQSASDYEQLIPSVGTIEKNTGKAPERMVVDGGFVSRENIVAMDAKQIDLIGSVRDSRAQSTGQLKRRGIDEKFAPGNFNYQSDTNTYLCPAGRILHYEGKEEHPGVTGYKYRACFKDCQKCDHRDNCCPGNETKGRAIMRKEDAPEVVEFIKKMETPEAKEIYKQRGAVAEFVHAWIKDKIGLRQFRLQGLYKVGIEIVWVCLTYNIQQWIRLSGIS